MLADQGFNISEEGAMMQGTLQIPAFTKGMDQLPPESGGYAVSSLAICSDRSWLSRCLMIENK